MNRKGLFDLVNDHADLAALEWTYEKKTGRRMALAWGAGAVLFLTAFVYLNFLLVWILSGWGVPLEFTLLGATALYALGGWGLLHKYTKRDPAAGEPFEGTAQELKRSFEWIQKNLS